MHMRNASILVLSLMIAGPAFAQDSVPQVGTGQTEITASATQRIDSEQITERLGQAGVEERADFEGHLVRAQSPEGHPILFLFGPEGMSAGEPVDINQDEIRGKLTQAGFTSIEFVSDAEIVRGRLGDDKHVLAMSGDYGWRGQQGVAQGSAPDRAWLEQHLGALELEDRSELNGRLMHVRGPAGQTLFVLVGPEGFEGDTSVNLSADDLSQFQQSGFEGAQIVEDVEMVRGRLDDMDVIALSGQGITDNPADATGSVIDGANQPANQ